MSAAVFAMLCRAGRSVLFARQNEAYALQRFTNGELDWKRAAEVADDHWISAVESLFIALYGAR